jgi:anaerobic selenocysteine-containing dehydrogenase
MVPGGRNRFRALLSGGGNPLLTWPDSGGLRKAMERLEFRVAMDIRMTETCRQADIVLPMASFLERTQLIAHNDVVADDKSGRYLALQRPIRDPGLKRSDWWFWRELACRLGYADAYPWKNIEAAIDYQLTPLGFTFDQLNQASHGLFVGNPHRFKRYEKRGFKTPSGKVELVSSTLAAQGHDALPYWKRPKSSDTYPLILNAGRRSIYYAHSQFRDLDGLQRRHPEAQAEVHPKTAEAYRLEPGERVLIESPCGSIAVKLKVTDKIVRGVVSLMHGWPDANANELTDGKNTDPILASAPMRSGVCRLSKLGAEPFRRN